MTSMKYYNFIKEQISQVVPAFQREKWLPDDYIKEYEEQVRRVDFTYPEIAHIYIDALIELAKNEVAVMKDEMKMELLRGSDK